MREEAAENAKANAIHFYHRDTESTEKNNTELAAKSPRTPSSIQRDKFIIEQKFILSQPSLV